MLESSTDSSPRLDRGGRPNKIRLKCHFNNDIRVVRITNKMLFVSLKDRLENDFGFHVILKYKDTDGDMINLDNQNDLNNSSKLKPAALRCRYLKHLEPHQWAGHLALQ